MDESHNLTSVLHGSGIRHVKSEWVLPCMIRINRAGTGIPVVGTQICWGSRKNEATQKAVRIAPPAFRLRDCTFESPSDFVLLSNHISHHTGVASSTALRVILMLDLRAINMLVEILDGQEYTYVNARGRISFHAPPNQVFSDNIIEDSDASHE